MNQITLARYIQSFLQPLSAAAADPNEESRLLARLGYAAPPNVSFLGSLAEVIEVGIDVAELLAEDEGSDSGAAGRLVGNIIDAVQSVSNTVTNLQGSLSPGAAGSSLVTSTDFLETLPRKLFDLLLIDFLSREAPGTLGILRVLSIVRLAPVEVVGDPNRVRHVSMYVAWERLPTLVSNPLGELKEYYGWGTPEGIDVPRLFESFRILAMAVGLRSEYRGIDPTARQMIDQAVGASGRVQQDGDPVLLRLPVFPIPNAEIGVDVYPIENPADGAITGLALDAFADAQASITIQASENVRLDAHLGGHVSGFGILVRPDQPVTIMTSASSGDPAEIFQNIALDADLGITFESSRGLPLVLLGTNGSTRLQIASMAAKVATKKEQLSSDIDFLVEASVTKAAVVIQTSSSDGFLAKVLPKDGVSLEFDFMIGFSLQSGLYFGIGGGVELALPINFTLFDVFTIETAYLSLRGNTANGKTRLTFAASALIKLAIGPVKAQVEKMGVQAQLKSADDGAGNLGPMNFSIGFKPPNGIGLKIEAEAVTGGGYLFFDFEEESYAGIAQVKIQDFIDIKLIGLLTTRLPELPPGQKGFSLLLIVTAEFSPITLAYGFTLNGVGGLIGINRKMMLEPLRDGVKTGAVNSILFPTDPVGRATQIISDLKTIFPPALNRFVLGPMIKIGWGASIITLEIGIVIEVPMPIRIAILGKITLALPTPDEAVAIIRMDILGTIDIARSDVSIDATLYDSRILVFTITGDMSMRLNWGESPLFLISIGGFNPRFERPPGFPTLNRLAISLATGENPRLRFEKYMAVTSNSFQMGAKFEVYASADISVLGTFTACAYMGFDTFFQFDPFHFIAEIYGGADIQRNGASLISAELRLTLDGPGPFRAVGIAAVNFLGRHEVSFEAIAGEPQLPDAAPASQPLALLRAAFADAKNWTVLLPERQGLPVTLRERDPVGECLLHPFGGIRSRQTVVPLNTGIERFGNTAPDFLGPFVVEDVTLKVAGDPAASKAVKPARFLKEQFAPGQYFALSDEEKISRPSFEMRDAGVELTWEQFEAGSAFAAGPAVATVWEYDTIEIDVASGARTESAATLDAALAGLWLSGSAGTQARLDEAGSARYVGTPQKLRVADASYVLIDTTTGAVAGAAAGVTYTDALAEKGVSGSGTAVVGQHEVAANV